MVPVPVSAFMNFGPIPVSARYITGTGIKWCPYWYWHICTLVQYQYGHGPLLVRALNGASTGASTGNVNEHYAKCHQIYASTSIVPPLLGALLELVICVKWYPVVYRRTRGKRTANVQKLETEYCKWQAGVDRHPV
jgi:hypothetical protein